MRRVPIAICLLAGLVACDGGSGAGAEGAAAAAPDEALNRAANDSLVLDAARALIAADTNAAMVTVDAVGQPRVRTVTTSRPDPDFTIWIATRPETRKVTQIRGNDRVALYYDDDDAGTYLSIMGIATLHTDLETKESRNFFSEERTREYWPDYPEGMVMIRVSPTWLEMVGPDIPAQPVTWRPQAVELEPPNPR